MKATLKRCLPIEQRGQKSINMSKRLSLSSEKQPIVISDDELNDRPINIDGGRMIECQNCLKWYHFSCLSLPTLSNETTGKHIQFKCGRLYCN